MRELYVHQAPVDAQFEIGMITQSPKNKVVRHAVLKLSCKDNESCEKSYLVFKQLGKGRIQELQLTAGQLQSYLHKVLAEHWLVAEGSDHLPQLFNENDDSVCAHDYTLAFNVSGKPRQMADNFVVNVGSTTEKSVYGDRWYAVEDLAHCQIGVLTLWPQETNQMAVLDVEGQPVSLTISQWASLRDLWCDVVAETKIAVAIDERGFRRSGCSEYVTTFTPLGIIKNGFKQAFNERFNDSQFFMELRACGLFSTAQKPWIEESQSFALGFCESTNQVLKVDRQITLQLTVLSFNQQTNAWVVGFEDAGVAVLEISHSSDVLIFRDQHLTVKTVLVDGHLTNPAFTTDFNNEPRSQYKDWAKELSATWPLDKQQDMYNTIRH